MTFTASLAVRRAMLTTGFVTAGCGGGSDAPGGTTRADSIPTGQLTAAAHMLTIPPLPHATDFLTAGCNTHVYAGLDAPARARCRDAIRSRNYTHFYLYPYNEGDYGGPRFDYYGSPYRLRPYLIELKQAGLEPVLWLVPDDAPEIGRTSLDSLRAMFERLVPVVDDLVSSYVLGLELDEYWSATTTNALGSRLSQITRKPIAVHQTPGRWDYCRFEWCDYVILQYGFDIAPEVVDRMTRAAMGELGKPVVAGEYEAQQEARAIALGDRGVAAGAAGFGNGGTPSRVAPKAPALGPATRD
jgi:hypothetical protein